MVRRTDVLQIRLEQSGDGRVRASLSGVSDDVKELDTRTDHASGKLDKMRNIIGGLGGAGLVAGLGAMIKQTIQSADEIATLGQRLGVSTEAMSELKFAAEQTDVEFNTLTMGMQRMQRRISEAAQGTGEAKDALKELNLSAEYLNRLSPDEQFRLIADAMAQVDNQGDRVRLAMRLFDSEGVALIQTMEGGSAAIDELTARARELGVSLDKDTVEQFEEADRAAKEMKAAIEGVSIAMTTSFAPAIVGVTNLMAEGISSVRNFGAEIAALIQGPAGFSLEELEERLADINRRLESSTDLTPKSVLESEREKILEQIRVLEELRSATGGETTVRGLSGVDLGRIPARRELAEATRDSAAAESEAGDEAEEREKKVRSLIAALREEAETHGMNATELARYKLEQQGASEADIRHAEVLASVAESYDMLDETIAGAREEQEALDKEMSDKARRVFEETRTPLERYNEELERLRELLDEGAISQETYNRAVSQAREDLDGLGEQGREEFDEMERAIRDFGGTARDAIREFVKGAEVDVARLGESIIDTFLNIAIQSTIIGPLEKGFGNIISSVIGGLAGGGSSLAMGQSAAGYSPDVLGFATGGAFTVPGSGGTDSRRVMFDATPGEKVTVETPEQQRQGGGGDQYVFNIDARGADAGVENRIRQALMEAAPQLVNAAKRETLRTLSNPGFA